MDTNSKANKMVVGIEVCKDCRVPKLPKGKIPQEKRELSYKTLTKHKGIKQNYEQ